MIMVIWEFFIRFIRLIIWCVECFCWSLMIWFMVNWMDSCYSSAFILNSMSMRNSVAWNGHSAFFSFYFSLSSHIYLAHAVAFFGHSPKSQAKYKWQIKLFVWIYGMDMRERARANIYSCVLMMGEGFIKPSPSPFWIYTHLSALSGALYGHSMTQSRNSNSYWNEKPTTTWAKPSIDEHP